MNFNAILSPIMFVGTSSDVGKSVIAAAFCRVFKQDGYSPAPFKAQNLSLNSYATFNGLEIGRSQAVQAEACGIPVQIEMNPLLLKPTSDDKCQLILNGKAVTDQVARKYYQSEYNEELFKEVIRSFNVLSSQYAPVVIEGAGSIAELNLKSRDIVNMRMAKYAKAATYLIADIERGGVFGNLYGTIGLLEREERKLIKGIIINKFRGDVGQFESGKKIIEDLCKIPVVGVLPFLDDIDIDEEDVLALKYKSKSPVEGKVKVAVILLERISNFTDFARLERDPRVHLFYTKQPQDVEKADVIILPGTKNTIDDLIVIKNNGLADAILIAYNTGRTIIGICGGYQMMGQKIVDPDHLESRVPEVSGLGILPVNTVMHSAKTTKQRKFTYRNYNDICSGYEIHLGVTTPLSDQSPLNKIEDGTPDGYSLNKKCWGTYLHGILDNPVVINDLLSDYTDEKIESVELSDYKEKQYDKLAEWIRRHINISEIYKEIKIA